MKKWRNSNDRVYLKRPTSCPISFHISSLPRLEDTAAGGGGQTISTPVSRGYHWIRRRNNRPWGVAMFVTLMISKGYQYICKSFKSASKSREYFKYIWSTQTHQFGFKLRIRPTTKINMCRPECSVPTPQPNTINTHIFIDWMTRCNVLASG